MSISTITPQQLNQLLQQGTSLELVDVRTPLEFQEVHATPAQNIPLDKLNAAQIAASRGNASQPLYVICRSGGRGRQACEKLIAAGCTQVVNIEGGTQAWEQAGLPVVRGRKVMSLERQVRIAAGLLVLLGTGLGVVVHPYWLGLSAFVGAGLVFAGVTDTCGMGLMLAKMPWNRVPSSPACSTTPKSKACCS